MTQRQRQLAAIVFTDIVGYASLMRTDERRATEIRKRHRAVFDALTPKYGGRILQYYGDGTLSIFNSSVSAVECAVEMQRAFCQEPCVPLRIGIHTGDIAYDDIDVFGDGVNVASRIEPCCIPGGILISGKVYDDIKNHEWLAARDLGSFTFKGMDEPLRLYAINNDGVAAPKDGDIQNLRHSDAKLVSITPAPSAFIPERVRQVALVSIPVLLLGLILLNIFEPQPRQSVQFILPEEPETSIAVLPFENYNEQNKNDYFSDGIAEDILSLLSRIKGLKVVSRASAMQYKGSEKDLPQIARELNADHLVQGSVRREGNKVSIVATLIDARNNARLWTETYDRRVDEIFDVQSQVAQDIAATLSKKLTKVEQEEICKKPTDNLRAYELYLQGREYYTRYTARDNDQAIRLFRQALEADPSFAQAYAGLGDALAQKAFKSGMNKDMLDSSIAMSSRAISLDRNLSEGYKALGLAYHYRGWYEKALKEYYEAVSLNPNNDMAINNIGAIYQAQGDLVQAIKWAQRALNLNPQHTWSMVNLARMYHAIGDDERCENLLQKGLEQHPDFAPFQELLVAVYLRQLNLPAAKEHGLKLIAGATDDPMGYQVMGEIALLEGKFEDAKAFFQEVTRLSEKTNTSYDHLGNELSLAYIEIRNGNATIGRTRLSAVLRQLERMAKDEGKPENLIALSMGQAILGEREASIASLQRAVREKNFLDYRMLRIHPFFENLRPDPAFRQLQAEIKNRVESLRNQVVAKEGHGRMT